MSRKTKILVAAIPALMMLAAAFTAPQAAKPGSESLGTRKYDDFQTPKFCGASCHTNFYQQWSQAVMSQAYTHPWDEIEYFKLALPQANKDAAVAGVKAGCNGCHAPLAYLAGDVPRQGPP